LKLRALLEKLRDVIKDIDRLEEEKKLTRLLARWEIVVPIGRGRLLGPERPPDTVDKRYAWTVSAVRDILAKDILSQGA